METQFSIIVIGNGLIGSAAARYLAGESDAVALLGPPEPSDWENHDGVFSSHYDEGRITRIMDSNPHWAEFAHRSIDEYPNIEKESGIRFFYPVGCLQGPQTRMPGNQWNSLQNEAARHNTHAEILGKEELEKQFPYFRFGEDNAFLEKETAGYINPRKLVQAQIRIAQNRGAEVIPETALDLKQNDSAWEVQTDHGNRYVAEKVLLCTGAFTNALLDEPLPFMIYPRTVLFARVDKNQLERFQNMPCIIWDLEPGFEFSDMYLMPPILYPDGHHYIKIGGDAPNSLIMDDASKLTEWFQQGGSEDHARGLKEILLDLMPELSDSEFHHKPCVTTYTRSGYPFIDELDSGLYTACAGCGLSAKSSNELGRIASRKILENHSGYGKIQSQENFEIFKVPDSLNSITITTQHHKTALSAEA